MLIAQEKLRVSIKFSFQESPQGLTFYLGEKYDMMIWARIAILALKPKQESSTDEELGRNKEFVISDFIELSGWSSVASKLAC